VFEKKERKPLRFCQLVYQNAAGMLAAEWTWSTHQSNSVWSFCDLATQNFILRGFLHQRQYPKVLGTIEPRG
jgi:hypothetical protein